MTSYRKSRTVLSSFCVPGALPPGGVSCARKSPASANRKMPAASSGGPSQRNRFCMSPSLVTVFRAAQRCKDEALVKVVRTQTRGKAVQEVCAITEKGLAYLLSQVSPRQILEDLVRAVESRRAQLSELVEAARQTHDSLSAFRALAE